jgi:GT2 family glycosyltransferase
VTVSIHHRSRNASEVRAQSAERLKDVNPVSNRSRAHSRALAVLIVAYRSADMLENCIESVEQHLPGHDVHVWDNSGPDHSDVRRLADRIPRLHWHLGSKNIGFAAATNRLAEMLPDCDLLLLNPDAIITGPMTLTLDAMNDPETAAAAPMVSESDVDDRSASLISRKHLPWDVAHRKLTLLNAIGGPLGLAERLRGTCLSNLYRSQPAAVEGYLTGACLAIRREAWDLLGPFNEEFFLYGEEAEWQRRAIESGWRVRLEDEVAVRHSANGTVTGDPTGLNRSADLLRASMALQLEYQYGVRTAEFYLAVVSLCEGIKRMLRGRRDRGATPGVLVTVDGARDSTAASEKIRIASALARNGLAVTVVSLQRIGTLPRELPASVRLLRRPWWWPLTLPERTPALLVPGTTKRERAFARLFQLRRNRTCIEANAAIDNLIRESSGRNASDPARQVRSS